MRAAMRVVWVSIVAGAVALLSGCGGGPPRRPTPPPRANADGLRSERFQIRGTVDEWHEAPVIVDGLERLGGVKRVEQDERTGKYVVTYDPQRTTRDAIRRKVIQLGEEQGRHFDPIFDDR